MKFDNKAWLTLYDPDYLDNGYLYHFTNIESAIKILNNGTLKFSKLSYANDTLESKPKIIFLGLENYKDAIELRKHVVELNTNMLQLLCFTMDYPKRSEDVSDSIKYGDYSGRGFSLPRMWAQYAENNLGICLVFKRKAISQLIKNTLGSSLIYEDKIEYKNQFQEVEIDSSISKNLLEVIKLHKSLVAKSLSSLDFFKNNKELVKYCYFSKLDDWRSENEYRFLAFGDEDYLIKDIDSALSGVIIGEKMSPENQRIISFFCENICEVKQITFTCNGCNLINIRSEE
mgnify:FL=1